MIGIKKHVGRLLFLILMLICFALSLFYSSKSKTVKKIQMLSTSDHILDGNAALEMQNAEERADNPIHFTIWGEVKGGYIENTEFNRSVQVNTLYVKGDSNLVYGNDVNLNPEDLEGCLLSENIIYHLYGSNNAVGRTIQYNGRSLIIRGTITGTSDLLIVQALSSTEQVMNYVTIEIGSDEITDDVVEAFNTRYYGFDNQINVQTYGVWAKWISGILPLLMLLTILIPLAKFLLSWRRQPVKFLIYSVLSIGFLGLFLWIVNFRFHYPADMIPAKWSDFSFWSSLYQQKVDEIELLLRTEKNSIQMIIIQPFLQSVKYSVYGIILFVISVRKIKVDKMEELLLYSLVCLLTSFIIICSQTFQSSTIEVYRPIWLLFIIYLFGKLIINKLVVEDKKATESNN